MVPPGVPRGCQVTDPTTLDYADLQEVLATAGAAREARGGPPPMGRPTLLLCAWAICEDYRRQGMGLTLRQLYYALVSRGLIPNGQKHYKRLGDTLARARVAGDFPMIYLTDRGRHVGLTRLLDQTDADEALRQTGAELRSAPERWLWRDRWYGQEVYPSVWIEKEALAGVFAPTCERLGVGLFPCKGYPSVSALHDWIEEVCGAAGQARDAGRPFQAVVLYCGDHDPDGLEIPRAAERSIGEMLDNSVLPGFARAEGIEGLGPRLVAPDDVEVSVTFNRIALTIEQIEEYNPPPFPAKETSSRYDRYVEETGMTDAWELDALTPTTLRDLITEEVEALFDPEVYEANRVVVQSVRKAMRSAMTPAWLTGALK